MEEWISLVAAFIAVISAVVAYASLKETKRIKVHENSYTSLFNAESLIYNSPNLLELHGITDELLGKYEIEPKEVMYLLHSIRAGQENARLKESSASFQWKIWSSKEYELSEYRKNQFSCEKTQKIFNLILKDRLVFGTDFIHAVDKHINENA